ncbi:hypothetical protein HHK36_004837 [Tetracentron sinense]|uniref:Endoplasmic reticulum-Golgi intermediate compartment protein 3 n=1 Tax=Tetracentron sinense TaxID=13715 RepID=A0A835DLS0_TETSI|nr:hypothetical protein HHK36_004837 [Tetracentron sinense]
MTLSQWLTSSNEVVRTMASNMLGKYDKYWLVIHGIMGVAAVLDPRYKMTLIEYYFPKLYGSACYSVGDKVKMGMKQALKSLDAFPRAEEHLLQKTQSGAVVSIIGLVIMGTLFMHELKYYLTTYTVHQMSVDLKRGETLPIHINMTFPSLPCDVLSVDAIDMSGKHEVDLDTNIWKLRLNSDGYIIGTEYLSDLVEKGHTAHNHGDNKDHHEDSSQKIHAHGFGEDAEKVVKNVRQALANGEGCRVYGVLDVQRVAGNFHLSVHGLNIFVAQQIEKIYEKHNTLSRMQPSILYCTGYGQVLLLSVTAAQPKPDPFVNRAKIFEGASHVNVSHVIHDLSFGPKYPGIHNPLDETARILRETSGTFKYYIKIVPTEYRYLSKEVLPTNQFSVTEYFVPMNEFDRTWPAVYFLYDLSPITVTIREERRSFLHFITRLCAVLGGTFALTVSCNEWISGLFCSKRTFGMLKMEAACCSRMLDRWMYRLLETLTKSTSRSILR